MRTIVWIFLYVTLFNATRIVSAQTTDHQQSFPISVTVEKFKQDLKANALILINIYKNVYIDVFDTRFLPETSDDAKRNTVAIIKGTPDGETIHESTRSKDTRYVFRKKDGSLRLDWFHDGQSYYILVGTPELSYALNKPPGTPHFKVNRLLDSSEETYEYAKRKIDRYSENIFAMNHFQGTPIVEFLNKKDLTIQRCEYANRSDFERNVLTVSWKLYDVKISKQVNGYFKFDSSNNFVLVEFSSSVTGKYSDGTSGERGEAGTISYKPKQLNEVVEVDTINTYLIRKRNVRMPKNRTSVNKVIFGKVTDEDFELESFDIDTTPAREPTPIYVYLLCASIVGFALTILFRQISKMVPTKS